MQHNNADKDYQSPSHADSYLMPYETPVDDRYRVPELRTYLLEIV